MAPFACAAATAALTARCLEEAVDEAAYRLIDKARPISRRFTQLVIALPTGKGGPFEAFPVGDSEVPDHDEQRPALHTSRGQQPLFTVRRDWAPVPARLRSMPAGEPPLTETARRLAEDFTHGRHWLGADTAVFESAAAPPRSRRRTRART